MVTYVSADIINILKAFLPQLLRYPKPSDPLDSEATALLMRHSKEYQAKVKGYVQRLVMKEAADAAFAKEDEDSENEEMSDIGSIRDDETQGRAGDDKGCQEAARREWNVIPEWNITRKMMYSFRLENFAICDGVCSAAMQPGAGGFEDG